MHTANDVIAALRNSSIDLSIPQINEAFDLLRSRHSMKCQVQAMTFRVGDKVSFTDNIGRPLEGIVTKINRKTVGVNVNGRDWRVGPTLLKRVS